MKNKSLNAVMILLAALLMTTTSGFAQRGRGSTVYSCCMNIPGLTEQQKAQITSLEQQHQKEMQAMRDARRKSGNYSNRDAYQAMVDQKVSDHRNAVRNLLNDDQKSFFDNLHAQRNRGNNQQVNFRYGNRQNGPIQRRGRGPGCW